MTLRRPALLIAAVALVLAVAGGGAAWWAGSRREPVAAETNLERLGDYGTVPAFSLTERSGRALGRDDLRGLVWIADFIYTQCTDSCPLQTAALARIQQEFAASPDLRIVSISVDPAHDTPAVLREYARRYHAGDRWLFLTGDRQAISCLALRGFRLSVVDPTAPGPLDCGTAFRLGPDPAWAHDGSKGPILHSARAALVDRAGHVRAYHLPTDPESMGALRGNLRALLGERAPASSR